MTREEKIAYFGLDMVLRAEAAEVYFSEKSKPNLTRVNLMKAGSLARKFGCNVTSSKFGGKVSSYYAELNGKKVRLSDHDLPQTARRDVMGTPTSLVVDCNTTNSDIIDFLKMEFKA